MTSSSDPRITALVRDGQHAEAARIALESGDAVRAAELFLAAWCWADAYRAAVAAGRHDLAYRAVALGGLTELVEPCLVELASRPEQARVAVVFAEERGMHAHRARMLESLGELAQAGSAYERAGDLMAAATCIERSGDLRAAGRLYERRVAEAPNDAAASYALGRILVAFGRLEPAAKALQAACRAAPTHGAAWALLVDCFDRLGMDEAVRGTLERWREHDPGAPGSVDAIRARRTSSATPEESAIGGRYRTIRLLGAGASGRVLLAHDTLRDVDVAVKILSLGDAAGGRDAYVRFSREAQATMGIDDPHVVRVLAFEPEGPYLVMEYLDGGTLETRLGQLGEPRKLVLDSVRRIVRAVTKGLDAAHRRGIVHRDLKPSNVFFDATGEPKIGDFGVAHLADLGSTLTGAMLGTLAYMAPEQITGRVLPTPATDFYALGVIAFRCLTGALPLPGPDFVTQHLHMRPRAVSELAPELGTRFDAFVGALLRKDSADRPAAAADVLALIDTLDFREPVSNVARAPTTAIAELPQTATSSPTEPRERFRIDASAGDGFCIAHDELLARSVLLVHVDTEERLAWYRRFARADGPWLQAVYDVEPGRVVLEHVVGVPVTVKLDAMQLAEVRAALSGLHAADVTHGAVRADNVRLRSGRAILLLPNAPTDATAEDDLAAFARL